VSTDLGNGSAIRLATPADHAALKRICLETGNAGKDASAREDDPDLLGLIYAVPYQIYEPRFAFIIEDVAGPQGYVLGALDTAAFNHRLAAEWYPKLQAEIARPPGDRASWTGSDQYRHLIHSPDFAVPVDLGPYPSHAHIDLRPAARGKGIGRGAMARLEAALRMAGSPGVHLYIDPRNRNAWHFYEAIGFTRFEAPSIARTAVCFVKAL
jgi:ribosomal protein S18 acetylase RimI-like enzyme